MMKNTVTATIKFSFKGEMHQPSITLDLDEKQLTQEELPELYRVIASHNGIDPYSYEFEVMESTPVTFSDAQGMVADFITEGTLDLGAFEAAWQEKQVTEKVSIIANTHLGVTNLDEQPELKQALVEAYLKGKHDAH